MKLRIVPKGIADVKRELSDINSSQVPFALAKALTRTAQGGQGKVRDSQKTRFTLRRAAWIRGNVRIASATKKNLEAQVFDTFSAMELQEQGGVKVPMHAGHLAVPLRAARPTMRSLIKPENMPKALMDSGRGFIRGNVMYRRGKVPKKSRVRSMKKAGSALDKFEANSLFSNALASVADRMAVPMYYLAKTWKVDKRYGFRETVQAEVNKEFEGNFRQAFKDAVKTAK